MPARRPQTPAPYSCPRLTSSRVWHWQQRRTWSSMLYSRYSSGGAAWAKAWQASSPTAISSATCLHGRRHSAVGARVVSSIWAGMTRPRVLPATLVFTIDCCRSRGPRQDALAALVPTSIEACDERAGTQVVELGEQRLALGIEGGIDQQSGHGLPSTEQRSRPNHQGGCPAWCLKPQAKPATRES